MRHDLEIEIAESVGESEHLLAGLESTLLITLLPQTQGHIDEGPPQVMLIAQGLGETFGLSQVGKDLLPVSKGHERNAQVKAQIDGLLAYLTTIGEMSEGSQRLLKVRHRLPIGPTCCCLGPCLPAVEEHLLPRLTAQSMVRHLFDLLG